MPHKHKRDKTQEKGSFELPPTALATPLPVKKAATKPSSNSNAKPTHASTQRPPKRKAPHTYIDAPKDDTPRAFARLMAFQTHGIKPRSGLDNGLKPQKRKRTAITTTTTTTTPSTNNDPLTANVTIPKIMPGERMSSYSQRVDAALPVSGLINKGKELAGVKRPKTKLERKMNRMQKEWREVDAKRKEQAQADKEAAEDNLQDPNPTFPTQPTHLHKSKKHPRRHTSLDDDPWAILTQTRKTQTPTSTSAGLVGLHDVVQAPPKFSKLPTDRFKLANGARVATLDVPATAGSLRRREELGVARGLVVKGYRDLMRERRGVGVSGGGDGGGEGDVEGDGREG